MSSDAPIEPEMTKFSNKEVLSDINSFQDSWEPIAIVGMACRYPGAGDLNAFWKLLEKGESAVSRSSSGSHSDRYSSLQRDGFEHEALNHLALLSGIDEFDSEFFHIAPVEAQLLDPQQRLLLETSWEAIEDAGIAPHLLNGSSTGVFVGISNNDYGDMIDRIGMGPSLYAIAGNCFSTASGRIAYILGLKGPAIATDTACSSSLVAVHQAVASLHQGEVNLALVGGVSALLSPPTTTAFASAGMLSPSGRCWTFDEAADGFVRGEGCGVLVLKRLAEAEASGDRIWAIIRGSAMNQDGASQGMWVPDACSQEQVIKDALDRAGVVPSTVNYLEAHGTGTRVGDPIELRAASAIYGRGREEDAPLLIGSVKTNIGHLSAASGVAGLMKVVLSMNRGIIPKHLNFENPTSQVDWTELSVRVTDSPVDWYSGGKKPLRAGVNSFGFSGTNAHVIVDSYLSQNGDGSHVWGWPTGRELRVLGPSIERLANLPSTDVISNERQVRLLPLSAKSESALHALAKRYLVLIDQYTHNVRGDGTEEKSWFPDLVWTASIGRTHFPYRAGIPFDSLVSLRTGLKKLAESSSPVTSGGPKKVAFLYTGQASQWVGMGRELYDCEPIFQAVLDRCDALLRKELDPSLLDVMFGRSAPEYLNRPAWLQPAIYSLECALTILWKSVGVQPDVVFGHSLGEIAAAEAAGVFTLEDGLRFAAKRGQLFETLPGNGAMAAVFAPLDRVVKAVGAFNANLSGSSVSIAAQNGVHQVLSGPAAEVKTISEQLENEGLRVQLLRTTHGYHSPFVDPILDEVKRVFGGIPIQDASVDFVSCVTGRVIPAGDQLDGEYWRRQARESVAFESSIHTLAELRTEVLIEIGPHAVLGPMATMAWPEAGPHPVTVSSQKRPSSEDRESQVESKYAFVTAVAQAYEAGLDLDFAGLFHGEHRRRIQLPSYPFQRRRHWIETSEQFESPVGGHPLIGIRHESPTGEIRFESKVTPTSPRWLPHHLVFDQVVVPGAMYGAMVVSALRIEGHGAVVVEEMQLHTPLVLPTDGGEAGRLMGLVLSPSCEGALQKVEIFSRSHEGREWVRHISGQVRVGGIPPYAEEHVDLESLRKGMSKVNISSLYQAKLRRGIEFGPAFQVLRQVWAVLGESLFEVMLGEEQSGSGLAVHPIVLDGCFQAVLAARGQSTDGGNYTYLPFGWDKLWLKDGLPDRVVCHARMWDSATHGHENRTTTGVREVLKADLRIYSVKGELLGVMDGFTVKRATKTSLASASEGLKDLLYEVVWRNQPSQVHFRSADFLVRPGTAATRSPSYAEYLLREGVQPSDRKALLEDLEWLARGYVLVALEKLGWKRQKGKVVTASTLLAGLEVVTNQSHLFSCMLDMLVEGGILKTISNGRFEVAIGNEDPLPHESMADPEVAVTHLIERYPHGRIELGILRRCGGALSEVLHAQADPLNLLFGGDVNAVDFYKTAPAPKAANRMLQEALAVLLDEQPRGRKLRVLEVGAGTGATTEWVIKGITEGFFEYCYTDISAGFFSDAEARFGGSGSGFQYRVLDIERDPVEQGFNEHAYDLIIAANVLHATRDLGHTLTHCRRLLAPSGQLIALESLARRGWLDLSFGQLDGWWRFADKYRSGYPLIQPKTWQSALRDAGFIDVHFLGEGDSDEKDVWDRSVILARQPSQISEISGVWVLVADKAGVAAELADQLAVRGYTVVLVDAGNHSVGDIANASGVIRVSTDIEDRSSWQSILEDLPNNLPLVGVVHLVSVDGNGPESTTEELTVDLKKGFSSLLVLTQQLLEVDALPSKGTWIVTKGAQVLHQQREGQLFGASLWGFGKVVMREANHLKLRMIDLDPAETILQHELIDELLTPDSENHIVIRAGHRYVARLVRFHAGIPRLSLPKNTGWRIDIGDDQRKLQVKSIPVSQLGPQEVRVSVEAAGLNFRDVLLAEGMLDSELLGRELCGRIVGIGSDVEDLKPGDRVFGLGFGTFGPEIVVHSEFVARVPEHFVKSALATIPTVFVTVALCFDFAKLTKYDRILIHAGAGGVGMAAIQWAQVVGAEVFATASIPKHGFLHSVGVEHVFNSRQTDFGKEIMEVTQGAGVTVVLNGLTGPGFIEASLSCLAPSGRFLEIGKRGIWSEHRMSSERPDVGYFISDLDSRRIEDRALLGTVMRQVRDKLVSGDLSSVVHTCFPMAETGRALDFMRSARHIGKIALTAPPLREGLLRQDRTYLVTGGLGGIGCEVAKWLADKKAGTIVLNGRRPPDPEAEEIIHQLRQQGTNVIVELADVTNIVEVDAMLERMHSRLPPLAGVFHSVGLLSDASLTNQSWDHCQRVLWPKVLGAWHLHRVTQKSDLDFFVLFSSMAGVLGNAGQANHAAANAFLDQLAYHRRARGLAGQSIQWGAWSGLGEAEEHRERISRSLEARGVRWISPDRGINALDHLLRLDPTTAAVTDVDWPVFLESTGISMPLLKELLPQDKKNISVHGNGPINRMATLEDLSLEDRLAKLMSFTLEELQLYIQGEVQSVLRLPTEPLTTVSFHDLGMDSLMAVELRNRLNRALAGDVTVSNTAVFDHPDVSSLARHVHELIGTVPREGTHSEVGTVDQYSMIPRTQSQQKNEIRISGVQGSSGQDRKERRGQRQWEDRIAIVGMACRFPSAPNLSAYWQLLNKGQCAIMDCRPDSSPLLGRIADSANGDAREQRAAFIEGVDGFDLSFFGITPRVAETMDPECRLILEIGWNAIEDAGINFDSLAGSRTGIYVGVGNSEYQDLFSSVGAADARTDSTGAVTVSHLVESLGTEGPTLIINAEGASSLVAVHRACGDLLSGDADMAIVAAANTILSSGMAGKIRRLGNISKIGECNAFDASADGFVRGEGCGVVLLKRLSDAEADGDRIWGVVCGSAAMTCAPGTGITLPGERAQRQIIKDAFSCTEFSPAEVEYLEAHGEGSALTDPVEIRAAAAVFGKGRGEHPLLVGSVKSNVGHLQEAAGMAGLIKVVLAMTYGKIPAQFNFHTPTQRIDWDRLSLRVSTSGTEWPKGIIRPPRAGVNAFGHSGSIAHVVIEHYGFPNKIGGINHLPAGLPQSVTTMVPDETGNLQGWQSKEKNPEERQVRILPLSAKSNGALKDLAQSYLSYLDDNFDNVLSDDASAKSFLSDMAWTAGTGRNQFNYRAGVVFSELASLRAGLQAVLETGAEQKSIACSGVAFYCQDGAGFEPELAQVLYKREPVVGVVMDRCDQLFRQLNGISLLEPMFADGSVQQAIEGCEWEYSIIYALECALTALWMSMGIYPKVVVGRGIGEVAAGYASRVFGLEDGLRIASALDSIRTNMNGSELTPESYGSILNGRTSADPSMISLVSGLTGRLVESSEVFDSEYWFRLTSDNSMNPLWSRTTEELGADLIVEIGPNLSSSEFLPALQSHRNRDQDGLERIAILPQNHHASAVGQTGVRYTGIIGQIAAAYEAGLPISFAGLFAGEVRRRIALPTYPFQYRSCWIDLPNDRSTIVNS